MIQLPESRNLQVRKPLLLLTALLALAPAVCLTRCSAGEAPDVIFDDDYESDADSPLALCRLLEFPRGASCLRQAASRRSDAS